MTRRLYYEDSFLHKCETNVVERILLDGHHGLILEETLFYPEGGGQPADHGVINGVEVTHVTVRESDHVVIHFIAGEVAGERAVCEIDWERRFDHMQHHTGQHILTHAFERIAGAKTIGFHLGETVVTIDLDRLILDDAMLYSVEDAANQIIFLNHPVIARLLEDSDHERFRMSKQPDFISTDRFRVIDIPGVDVTACGGTHVTATGQIGLIKIVGMAKYKAGTRVEFLCGGRALRDYRMKDRALSNLAKEMSTGIADVETAYDRQSRLIKEQTVQITKLREQTLAALAEVLLASTEAARGIKIISYVLDEDDPRAARWLASALIEAGGVVALIGTPGEKAQIIAARGKDVKTALEPLIEAAGEVLPAARGGGRPDFMQAGGFSAGRDQLELALSAMIAALKQTGA